jgi:hypothetical protein
MKTDDDLVRLDLPDVLGTGLPAAQGSPDRRALFGDGAVAGAIMLDQLGVLPQSVQFLAEIVRAGGAGYACGLAEPLPDPVASQTVSIWLRAGADAGADDEVLARWLDAVAALLDLRRRTRLG